MNSQTTKGIVLSRLNYGEADRILTVLTRDFGKLHLIAKGVRKAKSKLAGGVELFSISDIAFVRGRGEIGTLVSSRLENHFKFIVKDIERVNFGYEMLKLIDKNTEDEVEVSYFELLSAGLLALNDEDLSLAKAYFLSNLLKLAGQMPNLSSDDAGKPLEAEKAYGFDATSATFGGSGSYSADQIKFLRLLFSGNSAKALSRVNRSSELATDCQPVLQSMLRQYLRV